MCAALDYQCCMLNVETDGARTTSDRHNLFRAGALSRLQALPIRQWLWAYSGVGFFGVVDHTHATCNVQHAACANHSNSYARACVDLCIYVCTLEFNAI